MRFSFIVLLVSALVSLLTGCSIYMSEINKDTRYTEVVSAILIAEDHSKIVVVTPAFHYIFDPPKNLIDVLSTSFRKRIEATSIDGFRVNKTGGVTGYIVLSFKPKTASEEEEARNAGMVKYEYVNKTIQFIYREPIKGQRYDATGFNVPAEVQKLNKTYIVEVSQPVSDSERQVRILKTPLKIVSDNRWMLYSTPLSLFTEIMLSNNKRRRN